MQENVSTICPSEEFMKLLIIYKNNINYNYYTQKPM